MPTAARFTAAEKKARPISSKWNPLHMRHVFSRSHRTRTNRFFRKFHTPHEDCMKIHFSAPSFRVTIAIITALGCIFLSTASAQRLPQTIRPEHYRLWLAPDLKAATFSGVETID